MTIPAVLLARPCTRLASLAAVLGVLLCAVPPALAMPTSWTGARTVTPPANAAIDQAALLHGVSCASAGSCTAAGEYTNNAGAEVAAVAIESAGSWGGLMTVAAPANAAPNPSAGFDDVSCLATDVCVAVGTYGSSTGTHMMAATGASGVWGQAVEIPAPSDVDAESRAWLDAVSCTASGACTAVGGYWDASQHERALVATESGGVWSQAAGVALPGDASPSAYAELIGISCPSTGDCAAVGTYEDASYNTQSLVAEEHGGTWHSYALSAPTGSGADPFALLNSVQCTSYGNCTAVGQFDHSTHGTVAMAVNEVAATWGTPAEVLAPANAAADPNGHLRSISCDQAGSCSAVGDYYDNSASPHAQLMAATEAAGSWSQATEIPPASNSGVDPASFGTGIACTSVASCVAVSGYADLSGSGTAGLSTRSGSWGQTTALAAAGDAGAIRAATLNSVGCAAGTCAAGGFFYDSGTSYRGMIATGSSTSFGPATELAAPVGAAAEPDDNVLGVSCSAAGFCAATGYFSDSASHEQAMAADETAGTWGRAALVAAPANAAAVPDASLDAVSCSAPGTCAAAGAYDDASGYGQAMTASESAGAWSAATEITAPADAAINPGVRLRGVSCVAAGSCVAVGNYTDSSSHGEALAAVETAGVWAQATRVTAPADASADPSASFSGVSCYAPGTCVAVGTYWTASGARALIASVAGGTWGQVIGLAAPADAADTSDARLRGVSCAADGSCTAVGDYQTLLASFGMVTTGSAGNWTQPVKIAPPADARYDTSASMAGVSCPAVGLCAAVGSYKSGSYADDAMVASAASTLAITPPSLASGTVGSPYASQLAATGGSSNFTWNVTAGSLPSGLSLSAGGAITGMPTAAGASHATVTVSDPGLVPQSATADVTIVIAPAGRHVLAVIRLKSTRITIKRRRALVRLSCSAAPCNGALALVRTTVTRTHHKHKTVRHRHAVKLAGGPFRLAAGATRTVSLPLTRAGRLAVARAHHHRLLGTLVITMSGAKMRLAVTLRS